MAIRKTYYSVDTKNTLLQVEREDGSYRGYNMTLLQDSLSPLEVQLLVCTRCNGVMNEACYYTMIFCVVYVYEACELHCGMILPCGNLVRKIFVHSVLSNVKFQD